MVSAIYNEVLYWRYENNLIVFEEVSHIIKENFK